MSRARRLLELIQVLRQHRHPVSGEALAESTGISLRTLYRDIATLRGQGAHIDGEPGMGYVLRPGFMLPPLMFGEDELAALVLGTRWVSRGGDAALAGAACAAWRGRGVAILQAVTALDFGYVFTAADPDGHRLRVFAPAMG